MNWRKAGRYQVRPHPRSHRRAFARPCVNLFVDRCVPWRTRTWRGMVGQRKYDRGCDSVGTGQNVFVFGATAGWIGVSLTLVAT
jgi:hypothetical protein